MWVGERHCGGCTAEEVVVIWRVWAISLHTTSHFCWHKCLLCPHLLYLYLMYTPDVRSAQAPQWMKRPAGATFGFGGKLVSFSNQKALTTDPVTGAQVWNGGACVA